MPRRTRAFPALLAAGATVGAWLAFGAGLASGAPATVNCPGDNLQAAIAAASPGNTLLITGTCDGNFSVTKSLTLQGSPSATIDAQGAGRPLTIAAGTTVTLTDLTITGGNAAGVGPAGAGGGILSFLATLTLNNCDVTGNKAASAGGGIASGTPGPVQAGMLTVNSSRITDNEALGGGAGGILNHNGTAVVTNSVVSGNSAPGGGGIASGNGNGGLGGGGTLTITGSQISDNTATAGPEGGAGGIANGGSLTLTNSSVTGNQAPGGTGGGIFNHGTATISGSQITGNGAPDDVDDNQGFGGGIANGNFGVPGSGVMSIANSIVSHNDSDIGGGILNGSFGGDVFLTITHSRIEFNSVGGIQPGGGGIANAGIGGEADLTISGSNMAGNQAPEGIGGAIGNLALGGPANVSVTSTTIWARSVITPVSRITPNVAAFGGGVFNGDMGAHATVTLGSGALVAGNLALVDGGGVFNADGAALVLSGGIVRLNHPDDVVDDPNFF